MNNIATSMSPPRRSHRNNKLQPFPPQLELSMVPDGAPDVIGSRWRQQTPKTMPNKNQLLASHTAEGKSLDSRKKSAKRVSLDLSSSQMDEEDVTFVSSSSSSSVSSFSDQDEDPEHMARSGGSILRCRSLQPGVHQRPVHTTFTVPHGSMMKRPCTIRKKRRKVSFVDEEETSPLPHCCLRDDDDEVLLVKVTPSVGRSSSSSQELPPEHFTVAHEILQDLLRHRTNAIATKQALDRLLDKCCTSNGTTPAAEEHALYGWASGPVLRVMRQWPRDHAIQLAALQLLGTVRLQPHRRGLACVVATMQAFPDDATMLTRACQAMEWMQAAALAAHHQDTFHQSLVRLGLAPIVHAMTANPLALDLQWAACTVLWKLSQVPGNGRHLMASGCFAALTTTIQRTFGQTNGTTSADVHWLACAAVKCCCADMQQAAAAVVV